LEQLSAADPSNILYPQQIAYRQVRMARLRTASGRIAEASKLMSKLSPIIGLESGVAEQNEETRQAAIEFHLAFARVFYQSGDKSEANLQLEKALKLALEESEKAKVHSEREILQDMRFQWWENNGGEGLEKFPPVVESSSASDVLRSCEDALITAKESVIEGDLDQAIPPVRYLQERDYAEPGFVAFCTKYRICPDTSVSS